MGSDYDTGDYIESVSRAITRGWIGLALIVMIVGMIGVVMAYAGIVWGMVRALIWAVR